MNSLHDITLFYGEANESQARVYAQLPRSSQEGLRLAGVIRGPTCLHAQTLSLDVPLKDSGPGPTLLAEAIVPDPCFWTSDLPFLYEAEIELLRDGDVIDRVERSFGMRRLGGRGRSLYFEGQRWVLRAMRQSSITSSDADISSLAQWRTTLAAMLVENLSDGFCHQASLQGVPLVVTLRATDEIGAELRRLARHAAVAIVVIQHGDSLPKEIRGEARNVVLVQHLPAAGAAIAPWAQAVMIDATDVAAFAELAGSTTLPVIACRSLSASVPLEFARRACDLLQRDLAPLGDYAGYVV